MNWQPAEEAAGGFLDLRPLMHEADHISAYARTWIYSAHKQELALLVGSDNGRRVWLNGRLCDEKSWSARAVADDDAIPVTLEPGWNAILAKVANGYGRHELYLRLSDLPRDRVRAAFRLGDPDRVLAIVRQFVDQNPKDPRLLALAASYYETRSEDLARSFYEKLTQIEPENSENLNRFAGFLLSAQRYGRDNLVGEVFQPVEVKATSGATFARLADGSFLALGTRPKNDTYIARLTARLKGVFALRLDAIPDPSLPNDGPGRNDNGNFVLSHIQAKVGGTQLPLRVVGASFCQYAFPIGATVATHPDPNTGWAIDSRMGQAHSALYLLDPRIGPICPGTLDHPVGFPERL